MESRKPPYALCAHCSFSLSIAPEVDLRSPSGGCRPLSAMGRCRKSNKSAAKAREFGGPLVLAPIGGAHPWFEVARLSAARVRVSKILFFLANTLKAEWKRMHFPRSCWEEDAYYPLSVLVVLLLFWGVGGLQSQKNQFARLLCCRAWIRSGAGRLGTIFVAPENKHTGA